MEVVYYFDKRQKISPVKEYLNQFIVVSGDKSIDMNHKNYIRSSISAKIDHLAEEHDGLPIPGFSGPVRGYSFFKIKQPKNKDTVIRILYFCENDKMVLLNAFEKPSHYDKNKERKKEEKYYKETNEYYNKFIKNPKSYENYKKK